eukprot:Gb_41713 [translate_table: standard]
MIFKQNWEEVKLREYSSPRSYVAIISQFHGMLIFHLKVSNNLVGGSRSQQIASDCNWLGGSGLQQIAIGLGAVDHSKSQLILGQWILADCCSIEEELQLILIAIDSGDFDIDLDLTNLANPVKRTAGETTRYLHKGNHDLLLVMISSLKGFKIKHQNSTIEDMATHGGMMTWRHETTWQTMTWQPNDDMAVMIWQQLAGRRNGTRPTEDCPGPWSLRRSTHAEHTVSIRRADQDLKNEIRKDASLRTAETHECEDRNSARKLESSDKVNGDTALLAETENCQPEARPSGASPNLSCESITASNVTHEPVEVINQRDSQGIPQTPTGESPQGTNQSLLGRLLHQEDELKETPWFFIKPHPKIDERTTQYGSKETARRVNRHLPYEQ